MEIYILDLSSQVSLKQLHNMFLSYPDLSQVLQYPGVPDLVGCFIEMIDPVSNLTLPGELSPALLELGSHHLVHRGDLLIVPVDNKTNNNLKIYFPFRFYLKVKASQSSSIFSSERA